MIGDFPKCCTRVNHPKIQVEGGKKTATIINAQRDYFIKIECDGCVMQQRKSADWIIEREQCGTRIIIELKGKNVSDAFEQIRKTAEFIVKYDLDRPKEKGKVRKNKAKRPLSALIVAANCPKMHTKRQLAEYEFKSRYNAPLHVVNGNWEFTLGGLMSFRDPRSRK